MNEFIKSIKPSISIDFEVIKLVESVSKLVNISSPRVLLAAPQVQDRMYFIREGVVRRYSIINGVEFTNWFFSKGSFAISEDSFFVDGSSHEYLETTGSSLLIEIKKADFKFLLDQYPDFQNLIKHLYRLYIIDRREHQYIISHPRINSYEWFTRNHLYTFKNIQLQHLASFLGISKEHLSKIRKTIRQNDKS